MIKSGEFREDLFYRLNVVPIFLPALAERKNDLEHLINTFIKKFNGAHSKRIIGLSPEAMATLKRYEWPGNIRELENVIEHAFILENSNLLTLGSLPDSLLVATGINIAQAIAQERANIEQNEEAEMSTGSDDESAESDEGTPTELVSVNGEELDFNKHKEAFEKEFIIKALKTFKGRINQTALHANIPKKTLLRKIEKYQINAQDYK